jgi:hypothetical protein
MSVVASEIFSFLQQRETLSLERHDIASTDFTILRRSLRLIAQNLLDIDDQASTDVLDGIRLLLSEWLTVPVPFETAMVTSLSDFFGDAESVQARWGRDIRTSYEAAIRAAKNLVLIESEMRLALRSFIEDLLNKNVSFKIYCHRRAKVHFETLSRQFEAAAQLDELFVHSLRQYRETKPFDLLIKMGPLRAYGWGSIPDAILTAPRFGTLAQFVWSGSRDDDNFGYDPIIHISDQEHAAEAGINSLIWNRREFRYGQDHELASSSSEVDDLQFFQTRYQAREGRRSATLIQLDNEHGIFYPPHSQILSFDPEAAGDDQIDRRVPDETLQVGMFIIGPTLEDVDLGGVATKFGSHSRVWKERLRSEFHSNADGLVRRLKNSGLNLVHLRSALENWCRPPTSVIHAPQSMRHFEILIQVLGLEQSESEGKSWWQLAWVEIRRSRGEAIQSAFLEKEIVEEQLLISLKILLPEIREKAAAKAGFMLEIPSGSELHGKVALAPVVSIEHGFHVPETELKLVHNLAVADRWRD